MANTLHRSFHIKTFSSQSLLNLFCSFDDNTSIRLFISSAHMYELEKKIMIRPVCSCIEHDNVKTVGNNMGFYLEKHAQAMFCL